MQQNASPSDPHQRGPQGLQGIQGPQGPAGPTGAQGPAGTNGVSGIQIVTQTSSTNSAKSNITATCPTGKTLIGGGADTSNADAWVTNSGPGTVTSGKASTWVADADERNSIASPWTLTVYAICATDQ